MFLAISCRSTCLLSTVLVVTLFFQAAFSFLVLGTKPSRIDPYQLWHQKVAFSNAHNGRRMHSFQSWRYLSSCANRINDSDGDTLQTLSELLKQKLQGQSQESLLITRLDLSEFNLNRTYVDDSTIAGRGLFARHDYPKGTLLTCYPGDALIDLEAGITKWGSHTKKLRNNNNPTNTTVDNDNNDFIRQEYMLQAIRDHWGIVAIPEVGDQDSNYLGHYANDGALCIPTCESELAMYVIESTDTANAMHQECEGCHMVTVATQDIQASDEIFVTYGPEYWSEQPSFDASTAGESLFFEEEEDYDENEILSWEEDFDDDDEMSESSVSDSRSTGKGFGSSGTGKGFG